MGSKIGGMRLPGADEGASQADMTQTNRDGRATHSKPGEKHAARAKPGTSANGELPGWTNGLRQLYDQVVDEDLPDSFRDLLSRLDDQS